jgi:hypothetical protein
MMGWWGGSDASFLSEAFEGQDKNGEHESHGARGSWHG